MAGNSKPLTPLRYPGGKSAFSPFVKKILETNNLVGGHYMEPFAGGCGVALDLLFDNYSKHIHINDLDPAIFHFWQAITQEPDAFLSLLSKTKITIDEWYRQKIILQNPNDYSPLIHGFAAFFLNRTNRSGILKAGVIGGKNQTGNYKLDARFNKDRLAKLITRIAGCADKIHVYNYDAIELINKIDIILPEQSFIYLDPPYYVKGQGLYRNFYTHQDHVSICNALGNINHKWIVSYDNCSEIKSIYKNYRQKEYNLSYCACNKQKGSEVMIYGDNVEIPKKPISEILHIKI
ncbi:MAG: DNA adenine methylase [Snodgrassella sp.]|uniref:DNA adenine methylase n=1 Tax=Snodgrassella sp. TaxID=2815304 RepID=UPI00258AFEC6|nr:DNA adenine methylase [Snodgrassella sp.]MCO6508593.1 DNA adenine methylase [Snodgrassella sp.]MCO6515289.1 DNA adenine methylase [Snodgrassella sp.]